MNLLGLYLLFWVSMLSISLLSPIVDAGPDPAKSSIFKPILVFRRELNSQLSANTEAESPGMSEIRVVHHQDLNRRVLIALIVSSALLGVILLFLSYFWICRHKRSKGSNAKGQKSLEAASGVPLNPIVVRLNSLMMGNKKCSLAIFDYQLLEAATNSFCKSNILGEGGSGDVFEAHFDENFQAAVKRISSHDGEREFENEVNWLSKKRHQNIIKLLGYCIHGESRFLVYEMMGNGSLETQLHGPTRGATLTWHLRLRIAVDAARGLEYLHEHCNPPVVLRDLKSSNVLLDSKFNAKLSDFGLAVTSGIQNENIKLSGTLGYIAPEYLLDGKLTDKSDVYAFGVVLLELLTGRNPAEKMSSTECQSIVNWAMPQLTDRSKLLSILDPVIRNTIDLKHLYQVAAVAVLCVQSEPSYRPLITDVLHSLIPLVPAELGGTLKVTEPLLH